MSDKKGRDFWRWIQSGPEITAFYHIGFLGIWESLNNPEF
jgi:hypothetical protein